MSSSTPVIALDAMGGDFGPGVTVPAAISAVQTGKVAVTVVGDPDIVNAEFEKHGVTDEPRLRNEPSEGIVEEGENPALAYRTKRMASIFRAASQVRHGHADAFVSMGSTGASIAAATVVFGNMEGIARGTLGGAILGYAPKTSIIDLGANIDIRPTQLRDFGALGLVFASTVYGVNDPTVALLNVGSEETKGNELVKQTHKLLSDSSLNYIGMIEAHDLPRGKADVVVCDGFIGNIILKLTEGLGAVIAESIRNAGQPEIADDVFMKTNLLATMGGGPLLGVNGVAIVGHGSTRTKGVKQAIMVAHHALEVGFVEAQQAQLKELHRADQSSA